MTNAHLPASFVPGPAIAWSNEPAVLDEIRPLTRSSGEAVCCTNSIGSCGTLPCFNAEEERSAEVAVRWNEDVPAEADQYAFRLIHAEASDPPWSLSGAPAIELGEGRDSVCYVLELRRLVDDAVYRYEERCSERPRDIEVGVFDTPGDDVASTLRLCSEPPTGYEDAWCSARAALCADPKLASCATYAARCPDGVDGSGGEPGMTGGSAGANGGSSSGGATSGWPRRHRRHGRARRPARGGCFRR